MKMLSIFTAHKVNSELINHHFNPVEVDYLNDNGEWVCAIVFNEIPDITGFLKELAKQGSFKINVERDKFDDNYYYHTGNDYIIKQHIPDEQYGENKISNFMKYLSKERYAIINLIKVA
ncbi:MAG: hypothetical protein IKP65_09045 [Alphaproteobacteria bacterium]|nr:hypothetical protein [Alphaproteobacteria bacterium]